MSEHKFLMMMLCIVWVAMSAAIGIACYVTESGLPLFAFMLGPSSSEKTKSKE